MKWHELFTFSRKRRALPPNPAYTDRNAPPFLKPNQMTPISLENMNIQSNSPFFRLPLEIRLQIYSYLFGPAGRIHLDFSFLGFRSLGKNKGLKIGEKIPRELSVWTWWHGICIDIPICKWDFMDLSGHSGAWRRFDSGHRAIENARYTLRADGVFDEGLPRDACLGYTSLESSYYCYMRDKPTRETFVPGSDAPVWVPRELTSMIEGFSWLHVCKRAYQDGMGIVYGRDSGFALGLVQTASEHNSSRHVMLFKWNLVEMLPRLWGANVRWITNLNVPWVLNQVPWSPSEFPSDQQITMKHWEDWARLWQDVLPEFDNLRKLSVQAIYRYQQFRIYDTNEFGVNVFMDSEDTTHFNEFGTNRKELLENASEESFLRLARQLETALCSPIDEFVAKRGSKLRALRVTISDASEGATLFRVLLEASGKGLTGFEKRQVLFKKCEGWDQSQYESRVEELLDLPSWKMELFRAVPETVKLADEDRDMGSSEDGDTKESGRATSGGQLDGYYICQGRIDQDIPYREPEPRIYNCGALY